MRRFIATSLLAILLLSGVATAADTFRFDLGVVVVGDSAGTLIQKSGRQPDRIVTIENHRGAAIGERWEYYLRDKQVNFIFANGKIIRIEEIR